MIVPLASGKFCFEGSSLLALTGVPSRWLVHSVASYYGLHTWSVTVGDPARREAYVGFRPPAPGSRAGLVTHPACRAEELIKPGDELPQPLYALV
jgi:hypothetical protein